jgi:hypothetical protein
MISRNFSSNSETKNCRPVIDSPLSRKPKWKSWIEYVESEVGGAMSDDSIVHRAIAIGAIALAACLGGTVFSPSPSGGRVSGTPTFEPGYGSTAAN